MQDESRDSLLEHQRDLWEMEARQRSAERFEQVFRIYAVLGALVGLLAFAYFLLQRLDIELSDTDRMILLTSGTGFALSLMSWLYLFFRRQRHNSFAERSRYIGSAGDFLVQWGRFEALARKKLDTAGRDFNRTSIRSITDELCELGVFSSDEVMQLEEILRFRNFLVHSGSRVDPGVLSTMIDRLQQILSRLEAQPGPAAGDGLEKTLGR